VLTRDPISDRVGFGFGPIAFTVPPPTGASQNGQLQGAPRQQPQLYAVRACRPLTSVASSQWSETVSASGVDAVEVKAGPDGAAADIADAWRREHQTSPPLVPSPSNLSEETDSTQEMSIANTSSSAKDVAVQSSAKAKPEKRSSRVLGPLARLIRWRI
jgi:hypothetical protein